MVNHLYFLRHCKTENGNQKVITGQSDIAILRSEKQIDLYQFSKTQDLIILSSPLRRCRETIEVFVNTTLCNPPIYFCSELMERNMGEFQGRRRCEAINNFPTFFKDGKLIYEMTPPGGESWSHILERVDSFITDVLWEQLYSHDVLLCSHNHIMKILYFRIMDIPIEENWYNTKFTEGKIYKIF